MCNNVKALRDEGKKRKKKILYTVNVYKKKRMVPLYCTVGFYCNFCTKKMFDNHELQNMYEKNLSEFSNIYIHSLVSSFT